MNCALNQTLCHHINHMHACTRDDLYIGGIKCLRLKCFSSRDGSFVTMCVQLIAVITNLPLNCKLCFDVSLINSIRIIPPHRAGVVRMAQNWLVCRFPLGGSCYRNSSVISTCWHGKVAPCSMMFWRAMALYVVLKEPLPEPDMAQEEVLMLSYNTLAANCSIYYIPQYYPRQHFFLPLCVHVFVSIDIN